MWFANSTSQITDPQTDLRDEEYPRSLNEDTSERPKSATRGTAKETETKTLLGAEESDAGLQSDVGAKSRSESVDLEVQLDSALASIKLENYETQSSDNDVSEAAVAFADFWATDDNQLCLEMGDKLTIICKSDADWWWAQKGECFGYVPTNHISSISDGDGGWQDGEYFGSYNTMKLHLEMLQDEARNAAYCTAIQLNQRHIQGKTVLDAGCGTGILSMFAVRHGKADKVFAVEASEFAKHTQALIEANGMSDSIQVLEGKVESVELPQQVDLIISEWMGTFLLFEWMIESVIFARDRWLKAGGVIWPSHASLYLVPCSAEELYQSKMTFWKSVHGFDFSVLMPLAKEEFFSCPLYNHVVKQEDCLSLPEQILHIDMRTVTSKELEEIVYKFNYTVNKDGILHGFASWFQVDFAGFDAASDDHGDSTLCVSLNTGPNHPLTHWKQTLFVMDAPVTVQQEDSIVGTITITRNKVWRRHLNVHLEFSVTSDKTKDIQTFSKLFPIWR